VLLAPRTPDRDEGFPGGRRYQHVIWLQILAGSLVAAVVLFLVLRRHRRLGIAHLVVVSSLAAVTTLVIGLQVRPAEHWFGEFLVPTALTSLALATEALLIARWLTGRGWRLWFFLPAFVVALGMAAVLTFTIIVVVYPGS